MPALVTPFDADGDIVDADHRHNVAVLGDLGIEGFLVAGSTGEGPLLMPGERERLVGELRSALGDKPFVLCGIAAESVRGAVDQMAEADRADADAVLVLTPTSVSRRDPEAPRRFYELLIDVAPLPMLLYSVPSVTAYELPSEDVARLATKSEIVGMKDSGGDAVRAHQIAAWAGGDFFLYAGASSALGLSVAGGAYGAITASANYAPTLVREVVSSARKGIGKSRDAQERLTGISRLVESRGIAAVKLAAEVTGLRPGVPRAPLAPLPEPEADTLRRRLEAMKGQVLG